MKINWLFILLLQIIFIAIYSFLVLFSIIIQPFNLILGFICLLIIPGANLTEIFKPKAKFTEKLGYMTILSLALINILMFLVYFLTYDEKVELTGSKVYFFNTYSLNLHIQLINFALILLNMSLNLESMISKTYEFKFNNFFSQRKVKSFLKNRMFIIHVVFFISIIGSCIAAFYSERPTENIYYYHYYYYKDLFTFFYRVPPIFYLFLVTTIISLTYILIYSKDHFFSLVLISIFFYCLWILPYLQIQNYFSNDPHILSIILNQYPYQGLRPSYGEHGLSVFVNTEHIPHRYSTSVFTSIFLIESLNINIDFFIWYIYPLNYVFIPFFMYSIFSRFNKKKSKASHVLIILTLLAILTPQFTKYGHSAATGVLGAYIFFILTIEFYDLMVDKNFFKDFIHLPLFQILFIIFLFFFLCLTRTEECIYLIFFIFIFSPYFFLKKLRKMPNFNMKSILPLATLVMILLYIFYFIQEFFGWISHYPEYFLTQFNTRFFLDLYEFSLDSYIFPELAGTFKVNLIILGVIPIIPLLFFSVLYWIFLFVYPKIDGLKKTIKNFLSKIYIRIKTLIASKIVKALIFPLFYILVFLFNYLYTGNVGFNAILLFDVILAFTPSVFLMYLFIQGLRFYELNDFEYNYFFVLILATSSIVAIFILTGDFFYAFYLLNARYFTFFGFFCLILIQNKYFPELFHKKKNLFILISSFLLLSTYYSLRMLYY